MAHPKGVEPRSAKSTRLSSSGPSPRLIVGGFALVALVGFPPIPDPGSLLAVDAERITVEARATSPVADAAQAGDVERVTSLVAQGEDVNAPQGDGMTALHWAAHGVNDELVDLLLAHSADVEVVTRLGAYTPLHLAARAGSGAIVQALLEAGASVESRTSSGGAAPLHFAAASGSREAVSALLSAGADPDVREESWQQTPLMFAAALGRTETIGALLNGGATVDAISASVDIAARARRDQIARRSRNARMQALRSGEPMSSIPELTPEQIEEMAQQEEERRQVEEPEPLSYGELVGGQGGLTALHHAVREGFGETARVLISAGADVNHKTLGDGTPPMLMAMINGHFDLALELMELGADPSGENDSGTTPLYAALNAHWAPKARYPQQHAHKQQETTYLEVMTQLLDAGVDPNVRLKKHLWYMGYNFDLLRVDTQGATPFWRAAYATDVPAMRLLMSYGADPTIPTVKVLTRRSRGANHTGPDASGLPPIPIGGPGVFPIHAAAGVGYGQGFAGNAHRHVPDGWLPAMRYLIEELGADVNERDLNGYTALHHAAARGDEELILYLVEKGADVTVVSRAGQTTADMANGPVQRVEPFPEAVALLERLGSKNNRRCVSC